ncbi:MAG TPA: DUF6364 family protein [Gemmatimonadaceae bacterium]|jgi:hypothetical protein
MTRNSQKYPGGAKAKPAEAHSDTRSQRTGKRPRNLSLSADAIERGEAYSAARGTTLSALVEQFLRGLPAPASQDDEELDPAERQRREIEYVRAHTSSPVVRELAGLLADSDFGDEDPREVYREHVWRRYGK